jgi:hypothetical protein
MILSTTPTRTIPFLEIFYAALTTLLGNLSTTCEHINVPHLALYKFMHILKVNIRTFKDIRKIVLKKQEQKKKRRVRKRLSLIHVGARIGNGNGSGGGQGQGQGQGPDDSTAKDTESKSMEIAIVREYLLQGKLHRAITFGMDVPGLLFGDATGKECPIPSTHADANEDEDEDEDADSSAPSSSSDEDAILEQRLFGNGRRILHECEVVSEAQFRKSSVEKCFHRTLGYHDFDTHHGVFHSGLLEWVDHYWAEWQEEEGWGWGRWARRQSQG